MSTSVQAIDIKDFIAQHQQNEDLLVLDTRTPAAFIEGFIPGAIFISLNDQFEQIAAQLLPNDRIIIILADNGNEQESINRLTNAGFNNINGYISGGLDAWKENSWANDIVIEIEADELMMDIPFDENLMVIDVRNEEEFDADHLEGAENLPLSKLTDPGALSMIEDQHNVYILSQTGYRSLIAASFLKRQGLHNVRTVKGGWNAVKKLEK